MKQISPTWGAVVPLMVYAIATSTESETGAAAVAELQRMADTLDAINSRVPVLLELLGEARDCIIDEEPADALENLRRVRVLLDGDA